MALCNPRSFWCRLRCRAGGGTNPLLSTLAACSFRGAAFRGTFFLLGSLQAHGICSQNMHSSGFFLGNGLGPFLLSHDLLAGTLGHVR